MPTALADDVGEQRCWEQLVTMFGKNGVDRPARDQVATPGRRVQLGIGGVVCRAHTGQSAAGSQQREPPDRRDQPARQQRQEHARSAGS
jgi:hypothetical protein